MSDDSPTVEISHPLWSQFLRWSRIRPKLSAEPSCHLLALEPSITTSAALNDLMLYNHVSLPDTQRYFRIATLLSGNFKDDLAITLDHHPLKSMQGDELHRQALDEVRGTLPLYWEAFQTFQDRKIFFRDTQNGTTQWEHPDPAKRGHTLTSLSATTDKATSPPFETISYVSGDQDKLANVRVDTATEGSFRLPVTQNLATALRFLRYTDRNRSLWADCLCLDQNNCTELGHQVARLRDISLLASESTLWLGTDAAASTFALETLEYLGNQVMAEADVGRLYRAISAQKQNWYDPEVDLPYSTETWHAIRDLLQRPWFHRLWVVQHVRAGSVMQAGQKRVSASAVTNGVYCLYSKQNLPKQLRPYLEQAMGTLGRLPMLSFTRLLYRVSTFKTCTDARDKIYGILGLMPRRLRAAITVSYKPTWTATDVYAMTMLAHLKTCQRLEHFHNCFVGRAAFTQDAPSWVPDWSSIVPGKTYLPAQFTTNTSRAHYSVSDRSIEGRTEKRPNVLRVRGIVCGGEVSSVTQHLQIGLDHDAAIRLIRQWEPKDLDSGTYALTGESLRKAYAMTLLCNITQEREPDWLLISSDDWEMQDHKGALFGDYANSGDDTTRKLRDTARTQEAVADAIKCCTERLLMTTEEGLIGLAPASTRPGDIIAVVLGSSTPLVLRPRDERGPDHFTVIGEAFVHGLEDANVLLGRLPSPWRGFATWIDGDRRVLRFLNTHTRKVTSEDPRLAPHSEWERTIKPMESDDPIMVDVFKHKHTGEVVNYDPRLEPEHLEARGVKLKWLSLV